MNLQEYKRIDIGKDEILPLAERMKKEGRYCGAFHAFSISFDIIEFHLTEYSGKFHCK